MNTNVTMLKLAVDTLNQGQNPLCSGWISTNNVSKESFFFILQTFQKVFEDNAKLSNSTIVNLASADFKHFSEFLIERFKFKSSMILPNNIHFFNALSNKWRKQELYTEQENMKLLTDFVEWMET
jgi:hypothetical protein